MEEQKFETFVEDESAAPLDEKDKARIMAALSYVGILFIVPLFIVRRKSSFLQFHLRQGMVLFFIEALLTPLPVLGWMLLILPFVASVYGLLQAFAGREWELPFVGKYARRITL